METSKIAKLIIVTPAVKIAAYSCILYIIKAWSEIVQEVHGGYCGDPVIAGSHFSVAMGMDTTMKDGQRMKMDEIAVFEVKE